MVEEGASILDIGAQSSRPGAPEIPEEEERLRIENAFARLAKKFPQTVLSVDTWRSAVAKTALDLGAGMVNDISAGRLDDQLLPLVKEYRATYVLMHMKGTPANMNSLANYDDVVKEVFEFLKSNYLALAARGIHDVVVDPGFGFAKSPEQNFKLLKNLGLLKITGCPILVGLSRKSMIGKTLQVTPEDSLNGTTVLHTIAIQNGARILRTHDVKEASQAIQLVKAL
jgi:dihydropteroate synthase